MDLLSEPCGATTHDFALASELSVEFASIQRKKNVEVDPCVSTLVSHLLCNLAQVDKRNGPVGRNAKMKRRQTQRKR